MSLGAQKAAKGSAARNNRRQQREEGKRPRKAEGKRDRKAERTRSQARQLVGLTPQGYRRRATPMQAPSAILSPEMAAATGAAASILTGMAGDQALGMGTTISRTVVGAAFTVSLADNPGLTPYWAAAATFQDGGWWPVIAPSEGPPLLMTASSYETHSTALGVAESLIAHILSRVHKLLTEAGAQPMGPVVVAGA